MSFKGGGHSTVKEIIRRNNLRKAEVIQSFIIRPGQTELGEAQIATGIKRLEDNLKYNDCLNMAKDILGKKSQISIKEFFEIVDCISDEMLVDDSLNDMLNELKIDLKK